MDNAFASFDLESDYGYFRNLFGPPVTIEEVATSFSVKVEDVLCDYNNFGGKKVHPDHIVFFKDIVQERLRLMPTLDKRQKSGPRVKGVAQYNGQRIEKRFADDTPESFEAAYLWEIEAKRQMMEAAKHGAIEAIKQLNLGSTIPSQEASTITLGQFSDAYLQYCKDQRQAMKTCKEKQACYRDVIEFFTEDRNLESITPLDVSSFMQEVGNIRSGHAANKIKKNLTAGWNWGVKFMEGFPTTRNPFSIADKMPEEEIETYQATKSDYDQVVELLDGQDKVIVQTIYFTAARKSEAYNLKWEDILFDRNLVRLWTKKRKGGCRESNFVPMTTELKVILLKWKEDQPIKSEYLFINLCKQSKGYGKPFVDRNRFMHKTCEDAGVEYFGLHKIRHLTATMLYQKGKPISVIQKVLRHKSPNMTVHYLHDLGLDETREAIEGAL